VPSGSQKEDTTMSVLLESDPRDLTEESSVDGQGHSPERRIATSDLEGSPPELRRLAAVTALGNDAVIRDATHLVLWLEEIRNPSSVAVRDLVQFISR
jgi:hypothetical protein